MLSINYDAQNLGNPAKYFKDFVPVDFGEDLEALARGINRFVWSPSQYRDGRRCEKHWVRAQYCALDFDDGMTSLREAKKKFSDCAHVIGLTKSHQKEKNGLPACDRFRVLLRFTSVVEDLRTFKSTMAHWIGRFGSDDACKDGARLYWPCTEIVSICPDGESLELIAPKATLGVPFHRYSSAKAVPSTVRALLLKGAPPGCRNTTCFKIAAQLAQCGFGVDEIISMITQSPISLDLAEISRAVMNGVKAGRHQLELHDGRRHEP